MDLPKKGNLCDENGDIATRALVVSFRSEAQSTVFHVLLGNSMCDPDACRIGVPSQGGN
jgi:hypothetical protein